jgi:predicted phosphohydrolase
LRYFASCLCCFVPLEVEKPLPVVYQVKDGERTVHVFRKKIPEEVMEQLPEHIKQSKKIKFICTSDTHDRFQDMKIPEADVLLHAGDFTKHKHSLQGLVRFNEFLGTLPHKYKYVIGGNHEVSLSRNEKNEAKLTNATYIKHQKIELFGGAVVLFMSNVRPGRGCCYKAEAFGVDYRMIGSFWDEIPSGVDIVVTHHPAYGIADVEALGHVGCPKLLDALERVQPFVHISGHVHHCHGVFRHPFGQWQKEDEDDIKEAQDEKSLEQERFLTTINSAALNDEVHLLGPVEFEIHLE